MILYGIPTCDTCRKARKALEASGRVITFRDVRADPLSVGEIEDLLEAFGRDLMNTRSTTWKALSDAERADDPITLLRAHPTLMKRPVIADSGQTTLGWTKDVQATWGL